MRDTIGLRPLVVAITQPDYQQRRNARCKSDAALLPKIDYAAGNDPSSRPLG